MYHFENLFAELLGGCVVKQGPTLITGDQNMKIHKGGSRREPTHLQLQTLADSPGSRELQAVILTVGLNLAPLSLQYPE